MRRASVVAEKLSQVPLLLREYGLDAWLLLGRETGELADPSLKLLLATSVTWQSAFLLTAHGDRIAIVGRHDVENVRAAGGYSEVIGYDATIAAELRAVLERLDPQRIGLSYSKDDHAADGLTHGMFLALGDWLEGTPYSSRLTSAEAVASSLRARKSPTERRLIEEAIAATNELFALVDGWLRPGVRELDVQRLVHEWVAAHGYETAWEREYCPTLDAGPGSPQGHTAPGDAAVQAGQLFRMDFGIRRDGYCSDLQRVWYIPHATEAPPAEAQQALQAVRGAIEAARAQLRPGAVGWQVDRASREALLAAGYPEYLHAVGHQVGQTCHDGGAVLGPRWPRYGHTAERAVEEGMIFTLELGVMTSLGLCSLEEMVVVTATGAEYLTPPQTEFRGPAVP